MRMRQTSSIHCVCSIRIPFFNVEWISYVFKNTMSASGSLPENRLCMSRELNREAQCLWALIRDGEPSPRAPVQQ